MVDADCRMPVAGGPMLDTRCQTVVARNQIPLTWRQLPGAGSQSRLLDTGHRSPVVKRRTPHWGQRSWKTGCLMLDARGQLPGPGWRMAHGGWQMPVAGHWMPVSVYQTPETGYWKLTARHQMPNTEQRMPDAACQI